MYAKSPKLKRRGGGGRMESRYSKNKGGWVGKKGYELETRLEIGDGYKVNHEMEREGVVLIKLGQSINKKDLDADLTSYMFVSD